MAVSGADVSTAKHMFHDGNTLMTDKTRLLRLEVLQLLCD